MASYAPRTPALSPEFRLLLLFSRLELNAEQARAAQAHCQKISDWQAFRHLAAQRFILPLAYRHLRRLAPPSLPVEQLDSMKRQVMSFSLHGLNVMTSLGEVSQTLLEPLGIPYITFKGPSLAARYYDEPALRFCRDIDILVPRERMAELLARALALGYTPVVPADLSHDPVSLAFVARYQHVITLRSPRGVVIEFHSRIDNLGTVYASRALFERAESVRVGSHEVSVMPTDELFVYICWHHTKHFWSRLHWLVDLDAMQCHPSFDRRRTLACAERHGLGSTVEVCLKMAALLGSPDFELHDTPDQRLNQLLTLSIQGMQGDPSFDHRLDKKMSNPDFSFQWQTGRLHLVRGKLLGRLRMFQPSYAEYRVWPLPSGWQWLYCFLRPMLACRRRLPNHDSD
ncbi:nucleotidyltransferase domain-containing protein [Halomonas alimentaria]|uniref:nucleotidyltransferase domain-containing protein n=1 Tax=Halomonas alimentaria TaxID=147248 RepID=UPI0024921359|nr:nucleotidyltransferase family protein [Halomonas alimentaria]